MIATCKRICAWTLVSASFLAVLVPSATAQISQQSRTAGMVAQRGQIHTTAVPVARVNRKVDNGARTKLAGHVSSALHTARDLGRVDAATKVEHMVMVLKSSDEQLHELHRILDEQQDKRSANFHQWVTPEQFGEHFGVDDADIAKVSAWLQSQGFSVEDISKSKRVLRFSGSMGKIESAFSTEMHTFQVGEETHIANNSEISVPEALSPVISGVTLNNFFRKGHMGPVRSVKQTKATALSIATPLYGSGSVSTHYVGPWDFATIYNTFPLLNNGITGTGSSIAVVGRSDIQMSDIQAYRSLFDLPANDPVFLHAGVDNGTQPGDDGESDLDVEIPGGIAPNAKIYFVVGTPTFLVDGITNSVQYIVENNLADIMSISYGSCESVEGTGGNAFNAQAFEQAAAQGISIFIAAGDNGPAGCDNQNDSYENLGYASGSESATPYSVSVGGTQGYEANTYWAASTQLTPPYWGLSALSYIPEVPWNESKIANKSLNASGLAGLWSGSGGISSYYLQPSWQRGSGITGTDPSLTTYGGNWVTGITLANAGSGYTTAPTVTFAGGGCVTLPSAIATLTGGAISSVAFNFGTQGGTLKAGRGFGCTSVPTITFTAAPSGGTTATATATIGPMYNTPLLVTGVPHRLMPDLSLNAASGHDATLFCSEGSCQFTTSGNTTTLIDAGLVGGTSVAAPSMAGIQALINQANGGRQGMPGYIYYALAAAQNAAGCNSSTPPAPGSNCAFQDITQGDTLICGASTCTSNTQKMGFVAGTGYDLSTGLGSVNAYNLATQWSTVTFNSSTTTLNLSQTSGIAQGSPITISGTVAATSGSGTPTGDVAFILSQGTFGHTLDVTGALTPGGAFATLSNGTYTATLPNLPGGSYTLTARYAGDSNYASSLSAPVPVTVNPGTVAITISPALVNLLSCYYTNTTSFSYGAPAYITATIASTTGAGIPTGNATITVDGVAWGTQSLDPQGNVYLVAGNYGTATNSCLYDYIFSQGPALTGGTHQIGVSYAGDNTFPATVATPVSVTVSPLSVTPTLSLGAQNITSGFTLPLVATFTVSALTSGSPVLASGPTGTVTFTDTTTSTVLATATVVPNATYTVTAASTSTYPSYTFGATAAASTTSVTTSGANAITAVYSGDANYAAATSTAGAVTVVATAPVATTTTLTSSLNPTTLAGRPTFTATIAAASGTAPTTGAVTFYDGTALLGTATVGSAHTAALRVGTAAFVGGTHSITAVYGGITANGPSTSPVLTETVTQGTVSLNMSGKMTGLAGQNYVFQAVLTPSTTNLAYPPVLAPVKFYDGPTLLGTGTAQTLNSAQGGYGLFTASFATTTLAAGAHTITAQYADTNYSLGTSNAMSVKVYGPSPVGSLDIAVGASTNTSTVPQSDKLYVSGWAADVADGSSLSKVVVLIDGVSVGSPTLGGSRPDVASAYSNSAYATSGYVLNYAVSTLSFGNHTVTVVGTNGGGLSSIFGPITFKMTTPYATPVGSLDRAVGASSTTTTLAASDSLYVSGWTADPTGTALTSVIVYVDGQIFGTPATGGARPDVASFYNNSAYANSGFVLDAPASALAVGPHQVTVVATNAGGQTSTFGPIALSVAAALKPPTGNLDIAIDGTTQQTTISQADSLLVQGWAADYQANGQVASVTIMIDGNTYATATLGVARPDVASYYNNPNWSNVGWASSTSASPLAPGNHSVSAYVTDHTGLVTYLPTVAVTVVQ